MADRQTKVIRYRRPLQINIGMVVFLVFFVYLFIQIVSGMTRDKIQIYEVGEDSYIVQDTSYTGLILRNEKVAQAPSAGFVNMYAREGTRISVGNLVCSIDETGQYTELLNSGSSGDSSLSSDQLAALKKKLSGYTASYRQERFSEVYDTKFSLQNQLLGYLGSDSMKRISELGIDSSTLRAVPAGTSGIVEYYVDGMEDLTEDKLTISSLSDDGYNRHLVATGSTVEQDDPIFKIITDESWYVYLPLSQEDQRLLSDQRKVTLIFHDINLEIRADFSLFTASDGSVMGKCRLTDYMLQLADKRYVTVSIKKSAISSLNIRGLKIPRTSVVQKEFYVIPLNFGASGGNDNSVGFYRSTGDEADFISPTIAARNDEYYFIDKTEISAGTMIRAPGTSAGSDSSYYTVAATAVLPGVYSVNRGYAVFRQITVLDEDSDYCIVQEGQKYGLAVYDHIVLDGSMAEEGMIVY